MRLLLLLFVFSFSFEYAKTQNCGIPNAGFEDWVDVGLELDTSGTLATETYLLPQNFNSYSRFLSANLNQTIGSVTDVELAESFFGIERSEDASEGLFSMKLSGNQLFPLSDAAAHFPCNGILPEHFYLDLKHVGTGKDTLDIYLTFGEKTIIPDNLFELFKTSGFLIGQAIANVSTEWATLTLPTTDNEIGLSSDSVFLWFVVSSDSLDLIDLEESYFLIDNLSFNKGTSISENELPLPVHIYPQPFIDRIFINNTNEKLEAQLYDKTGRKLRSFEVINGLSEYPLPDLNYSGNYILELFNKDKSHRSSYIIIKD